MERPSDAAISFPPSSYSKQQRGLSPVEITERWKALPEEIRHDIVWRSRLNARQRTLWRYTFAVIGIIACLVAGAACLAIDSSEHPNMTTLGYVGLGLLFAWLPLAQVASTAKSDLIEHG